MDEFETTESDLWFEKEKVCDQRTFVAFLKALSEEEGNAQKLSAETPESISTVLCLVGKTVDLKLFRSNFRLLRRWRMV